MKCEAKTQKAPEFSLNRICLKTNSANSLCVPECVCVHLCMYTCACIRARLEVLLCAFFSLARIIFNSLFMLVSYHIV